MEYKQVWRFYADRPEDDSRAELELQLPAEESHYACSVLRLAAGERVEIADGEGWTAQAVLVRVDKKAVIAKIDHCATAEPLKNRLVALVGLTKPGALDEVIQVCVEAGVTELVLFRGERSTSRQELRQDKVVRQIRELCRITKSAWSLRMRVVESLQEAVSIVRKEYRSDRLYVCDERPAHSQSSDASTPHLMEKLGQNQSRDLVFVVGPEASFGLAEYHFLSAEEDAGRMVFVTLGPRILRTPAAVAAAAYILSGVIDSSKN